MPGLETLSPQPNQLMQSQLDWFIGEMAVFTAGAERPSFIPYEPEAPEVAPEPVVDTIPVYVPHIYQTAPFRPDIRLLGHYQN